MFKNSLLEDFDFIDGSGGCDTDDPRFPTEEAYYSMSFEKRDSIDFHLLGIAVFLNNKVKFVIDVQGFYTQDMLG